MLTRSTTALPLPGCTPVPLAHYLKALGILRLVAEQADPEARGHWEGETFSLHSSLDADALVAFFSERYRPTPILAPWNGGSGFWPKDNTKAISAIRLGTAERLELYRIALAKAALLCRAVGSQEKPSGEQKETLLQQCRSMLPDEALPWLDAAYVLTDAGAKYPPLLGTGGNDGRLDFTNNFMQRICDVMDPATGESTLPSIAWLRGALFGEVHDSLQLGSSIGQFFPSAAGGANRSVSFTADSLINPWDFVLMLEGAVLFAAASVKRLEASRPGVLSYPFSVRQSGVGYGSAASSDERESRAEMWLPLWHSPTRLSELRALFSEGRAQLGGRPARNGVDFARAIASLGTDRGIQAFQRYGFQVRNGQAYFATPLDRMPVVRQPQVDLLSDIDAWLDSFRGKAAAETAPASARRALRRLETAIMALCRREDAQLVQAVLVALGDCEAVMAANLKWTSSAYLQPVPLLQPRWIEQSDDRSVELRLAAALASLRGPSLRSHREPVTYGRKGEPRFLNTRDRDVVWHEGTLLSNLLAVLDRRMLRAVDRGSFPDEGTMTAALGDVSRFIEGQVDDERLSRLVGGLILLDWSHKDCKPELLAPGSGEPMPDATYAIVKLCHHAHPILDAIEKPVPMLPEIARRLLSGDSCHAVHLAARRLRGSRFPVAANTLSTSSETSRRIAAALLFPLDAGSVRSLAHTVLDARFLPPNQGDD